MGRLARARCDTGAAAHLLVCELECNAAGPLDDMQWGGSECGMASVPTDMQRWRVKDLRRCACRANFTMPQAEHTTPVRTETVLNG